MSNESILVVDDEPDIRNLVKEILEDEGYRVDVAEDASSARRVRQRENPDLVLLDIWMPDEDGVSLLKEWKDTDQLHCPVIMMSGHGTVETAVEATRLGAYDFVEKPLSLAKLLLTVQHALEAGRRQAQSVKGVVSAQQLVGTSPAIAGLREQAERVAGHDMPLLLHGEPGSGREALARYVHMCGRRARAPFVELGSEPAPAAGDTSAAWFEQHVERAGGGTLYVRALAELGAGARQVLLRLLEQPEAERPVRVILGSVEALEVGVGAGRLPAELYYALNVVQLRVPPLREHLEDVPELLEYFVNYFAQHEGLAYRHFNLPAQNRLRNHRWPGNVHELRNLVQRLMILGNGVEISLEEVEQALVSGQGEVPAEEPGGASMPVPLHLQLRQAREAFERAYLERQLEAVGGNISELAKRAGMERTHLYRKMRSLGISPQKRRG